MDQEQYIIHETYPLTSRDADVNQKLRISSLINLYIQAAWKHAEILGLGVSYLHELNLGWVLSRFTVKIHKLPKWPGQIKVSSWPKGMNRLFYIRDAVIVDDNNIACASLTSGWLIIDTTTKRPKIHLADKEFLTIHKDKHAVDKEIPTLKFETEYHYTENYKVKFNDIDMNKHLTTIRYVELILDTYGLSFLNSHDHKEISVNFIKEITFGSNLSINRIENGNEHYFEIINSNTSKLCFRAQINF